MPDYFTEFGGGKVEADSPLAQELEVLHSLAVQLRGPLLDQLVVVDVSLTSYLVHYFCPEPTRRPLLEEHLTPLSLEAKIDLFRKAGGDPELVANLEGLRGLRNDLAHGLVDNSDEGRERFARDHEVTFMVHGKNRRRMLSSESVREKLELSTRCCQAIWRAEAALKS